jgi:gliding-associated putative ABC transporter substrate-binding component GldG
MNKKTKEIIFGILFVGILIFTGLNAGLYSLRIDATENKMFSIHPVSQNLFKDIDHQVQITYYLTDKLKTTSPVYDQIEDIVREYAAHARGKIQVRIFDPTRDNKLQEVQEFGIQQFDSGRRDAMDEASFFIAYSGIVIEYLDRHKVIPRIASVDTLEYELSSKIRSLVSNRTKKIGYLIDDPTIDMQQFTEIAQYLRQEYDIQQINKGDDIPSTVDAIVVLGGMQLSEFDLYPIDQYLMRGGRAFFAADAVTVNMQYGMAIPARNAPLLEMLKKYGVTILPQLILEERRLSVATTFGMYNYWLNTFQDFVAKDNPITAHYEPVYFFWASPLELTESPAVKLEKLISSSPYSVAVKDEFKLDPKDVDLMYKIYSGQGTKSYPLVAALSGSFTSFFKDKPIPTEEGVTKDWQKTEGVSAPTRMIVAGDATFLAPGFINNANFRFFINCLAWLTNDDDLLAIRTRAQRDATMAKIEDPAARKTATDIIIVINLVGMPLIVIGFGVINFLLRRKRRKIME